MEVCQKTICFTGFDKVKKNELIDIAKLNGFIVRADITKDLNYLCCGNNAGPSKINKAKNNNSILLTCDSFYELLSKKSSCSAVEPFDSEAYSAEEKRPISIYDENDFLDYLWSAIDKGSKISITYHGGSREGERRSIVPLSLMENFVLRAVDLSSPGREVKSFSIGKIEIDGIENFTPPVMNGHSKPKKKKYRLGIYKNIEDVSLAFRDTLVGMGWHVATYEDEYGECIRLDVCDFFKNGKPRKTPVATLYFSPENKIRPFVCKSRDMESATTYSNLDNAAEMFLSLAYAESIDDEVETSS
ncbi:BRCT domain-containing protein [Chania multitudinisentens]|uniref:BRCT domain-containing protein n=1 Tax=Chania multitudinisentens TaxID=1639108 RepID=UPI0004635224|nr:BRCT domain-containing protein [Chania multitudinisentens]